MVLSSKIQLGVPSRKGGFAGLVIESNIPVVAIFLGGAIAIGVLWMVKQLQQQKPPAELEKPVKLAPSRSAITN